VGKVPKKPTFSTPPPGKFSQLTQMAYGWKEDEILHLIGTKKHGVSSQKLQVNGNQRNPYVVMGFGQFSQTWG